jgi:hypothetical protein
LDGRGVGWFNGGMFVTTHSAGVLAHSPAAIWLAQKAPTATCPGHRRLAGQATTRRLEGRKGFARPELSLFFVLSCLARPRIQAAASARGYWRFAPVAPWASRKASALDKLGMTGLLFAMPASRQQALRERMTASFREMRAVFGTFSLKTSE